MSSHGDDGSSSCSSTESVGDLSTTSYFTLHQTKTIHNSLILGDPKVTLDLCLGPEGDSNSNSNGSTEEDTLIGNQQSTGFPSCAETRDKSSLASILDQFQYTLRQSESDRSGRIAVHRTTKRTVSVKLTKSHLESQLLLTSSSDTHFPKLLSMATLYEPLVSYLLISELCLFSLKDMIDRNEDWVPLCPNRAKKILHDCVAALEFLHTRFIAHRNIRLDHVLVSHREASVKLCGLSRSHHFPEKPASASVSTSANKITVEDLLYQSPEMLPSSLKTVQGLEPESKVEIVYDPFPADVYSLGVIACWLLTGSPPHSPEAHPVKAKKLKYNSQSQLKDAPWKIPTDLKHETSLMLSPRPCFRPTAAYLKYEGLKKDNEESGAFMNQFLSSYPL